MTFPLRLAVAAAFDAGRLTVGVGRAVLARLHPPHCATCGR